MKVKLREIKVIALDTPTIILLTKYVRLARVSDGAELRMQQADIVHQVFKHASVTSNPDLIVLAMKIKKSMSNHITKTNLEKPSFNIYAQAVA